MSMQVYYRRWRPQRLEELVGQEPVVRTLKQAIARKRVAHAYLFCGPRGTGKTSTARVLAKAINCLNPQDGEPCNACRLCLAVNEGRALDLVEIDAASNRGIDEIRSIREKVHYAAIEAAYKVYVLDEAHMLTDAAADALLKTLEEPPAHVIFILCTTEAHKLPPTIVSRCQRFDFRRITPAAIVERLARICGTEGIEAEPAALRLLARSASGSLRDAENLLEQAVTSFGSPLRLEQVSLLLGLTADDRVRALLAHTLDGRVAEALTMVSAIAGEGVDLSRLHRQMVDEVRDLLLIKSGAMDLVSQPDESVREMSAAAAGTSAERLVRVLRLLGQVTFRSDAPTSLPLELAIIEAAQGDPGQRASDTEKAPVTDRRPPIGPRQELRKARAEPVTSGANAPTTASPPPSGHAATPVPPASPPGTGLRPAASSQPLASTAGQAGVTPVEQRLEREWEGIVKTLNRQKYRRFNPGALLRDCRRRRLEGDTLALEFTHSSHLERMKEEMDNPESRRTFLEVVTAALGITSPLKLAFTASNGVESGNKAAQSPLLQAALGMGGKILGESEEANE